jgi:hypothetical protein
MWCDERKAIAIDSKLPMQQIMLQQVERKAIAWVMSLTLGYETI